MKTSAVLLFSALLFGSVANATLQALPGGPTSSYIGTGLTITAGWNIGDSLAGGGAFEGAVTPKDGKSLISTAFWCVDDQTYFSPGSGPALANITRLSDLSDTALSNTWYRGATPGWTDTSVGLDSSKDTVQNRLLMAAYLVQQYGGFLPFTTISGSPSNPGYTNTDVQHAIWTLMNNTAFNGHWGPDSPYHDVSGTGVAYWIAEAAKHYDSVNKTSWALVSWQASGDILTSDKSGARQTFLVAVNPEPGFYGVLALGLCGLVLAFNRKRKSA